MKTTILAGLAATALLAAASGLTPAQAMPAQPSAISQANEAISNVVDVQWRRRYWGPRYYRPYYGGYYPYYRPYPYRYYAPGPGFYIGPRGFGFGIY